MLPFKSVVSSGLRSRWRGAFPHFKRRLRTAVSPLKPAADAVTLRGVPLTIIARFLNDPAAVKAVLRGNKRRLHDRLGAMGIEEHIKAHYRARIRDEHALDLYIHQLFFNLSGYVGTDFRADARGVLVARQQRDPDFEAWFRAAYDAGLLTGSKKRAGVQYVIDRRGKVLPFAHARRIYPPQSLKKPNDGR
jgi:hypothetical protein